jgi:hypothetical protein
MKLYVCNKAGECDDLGCIHHEPHHKRKDGEEDYWHFPLICSQWRDSNRECHERVRCLIAGSDKLNENHDYEDCTYFDSDTLECCNGVDEGTICAGCYGLQCEAYERYFFGFDYIELERR